MLGSFLASGTGAPEDRAQTLLWHGRAAARGHRGAIDAVRASQGLAPVCRNPIAGCRLMQGVDSILCGGGRFATLAAVVARR